MFKILTVPHMIHQGMRVGLHLENCFRKQHEACRKNNSTPVSSTDRNVIAKPTAGGARNSKRQPRVK